MANRVAAVQNAELGKPPPLLSLKTQPGADGPPGRSSVPRRVMSESAAGSGAVRAPPAASTPLDIMAQLLRAGPSVVKTRSGSVLSRGFIMKTDHYPSGRALDLDLNLHGAPNFRAPRRGSNLNVFGVAQPRTQGLRAILSALRAKPGTPNPTKVIWFSTREEPIVYISGRPFVLRDAAEPRETLKLSDRAENLEAIEERLKADILAEAARYGGLLLTHNEAAVSDTEDGEGVIIPTWTAVDTGNVKTSCELYSHMREQGWNVEYHRIPITPNRPIEDNYLDAYLHIILPASPTETALVFSCGTGAVRTTFAMVAATIVRRQQIINLGLPDPYALPVSLTTTGSSFTSRSGTPALGTGSIDSGRSTPGTQIADSRIAQSLEQANAQQDMNRSLLRLTYLFQQSLRSQSAIDILLTQPGLLDNLRKAHMGHYGVILSLLGVLDNGLKSKKLVDSVIDACDHVVNLREDILTSRVKYALTTSTGNVDDARREDILEKAVQSLQKYYFLIAYANYMEEQGGSTQTFSAWLQTRTEIWNQITFLRKAYGSRLNIFAPVNDLSSLSKGGSEDRALVPGQNNDVAILGGQILGDEYTEHVIKNRSGIILREGTLLKSDQWLGESQQVQHAVRGAINFRNIPGTQIYALGQPTADAVDEVVNRVKNAHPTAKKILWIALREEPIVYVNGAPYCLRRERFSLRNMKDYGGISASRLEVLEERLRDDVISELTAFGGRLLLHTETSNGSVIPIWEDVEPDNVVALKDVMTARRSVSQDMELHYIRIPITAERPPDFSDLSELMEVVMRSDSADTPIVVNCQLGRGRSTLTSIILLLIQEWLQNRRWSMPATPHVPHHPFSESSTALKPKDGYFNRSPLPPTPRAHRPRHSYQVINNLLRIIRKGPAVKDSVDEAIDVCGEVENLRDAIEVVRLEADQVTNDWQKRELAQKGLQNLRRYFQLIIFQAYLQSTEPDTIQSLESFETFVQDRPVIKTFEKELQTDSPHALKPLERIDFAEGEVPLDEVKQVVANRSGSILSASTILKSDFFSNLQKMSLPERIDGAPNFRRVPLTFLLRPSGELSPIIDGKMVCGSGMPTVDGLRRTLERVNSGPGGSNSVFWTSLREEPVIYVAGRPHVLRLVDKPLENVEATGVTTAVVESMEKSLKKDVIRELKAGNGRILLHDEVEERPGVFSIIPIWENVSEADIMTPRDVFNGMLESGYKVDYGRVAITDEQAPLPDALAQLVDRVASGLDTSETGDFVFNCQMGRGRTTSGMVTASLIATTMNTRWEDLVAVREDAALLSYDTVDGPSEEEAYLKGEYKTILQLVGVLSHGKIAKLLTDRAVDLMQDVQNLRKAIYPYKLKMDTATKGSREQRKFMSLGVNYLYRYATLIAFCNFLLETRENKTTARFPDWLKEHREITTLLSRTSLD